MFDTTWGGCGGGCEIRGTIAALPVAVAVHALVLGAVAVGQLWAVEAVPEPYTVVAFFTLPPPPPPFGGGGEKRARSATGVRGTVRPTDVQPAALPDVPASHGGSIPGGTDGTEVGGGDPRGTTGGVTDGVPSGIDPLPSAEPATDTVLPVHLVSTAPVAIDRPVPIYPELARRARVEGTVVLQAVIDREGSVVDVRILRDVPLGCGEAARAAVRSWRYEPATLNGRKVSVSMTVTVKFELRGGS